MSATSQVERKFIKETSLIKALPPRKQNCPCLLRDTLFVHRNKLVKARNLNNRAQSGATDNQNPDKLSLTLVSAPPTTTIQHASKLEKQFMEKNEMPNPPSRIPFALVCSSMPEQNELALFESANYKTYVPVGIKSHEMTELRCVVEVGAGTSLVNKSSLQPT